MEGTQQNQPTEQTVADIMQDVVDLAQKICDQFPLDLNKPAGVKYSVVEDLVLWLNVRGNSQFGQVNRSAQSIKSRKIVLKDFNLKHIKEIESSLGRKVDLNKYQMIYPRNKIYSIQDAAEKQDKAEKAEMKRQQAASTKSKDTSLGESRATRLELDNENEMEPFVIPEEVFEDKQERAPQAPSTLLLRAPNISVCFVKDKIGFLDTQRIREICVSMDARLKGIGDNDLRKMFTKSMRDKDFEFEGIQ